ncbi:MAG: DUF4145 domain-containing protein [Anaerolineales bacterium]|nr:MAG: DUF4145 domain-containing protein [Anaerolineales bacterium]
MQLNQLISQRFNELEEKIEGVRQSRQFELNMSVGHNAPIIPYAMVAGWATNVQSLLHRTFGDGSIHLQEFRSVFAAFKRWETEFDSCVAVFMAAKEDYEGGYLFNVITLVKAEVLADAIEQARELLKNGYKDPAAVLGRVSLEVSLKDLCTRNGIPIAKLDKMNADICKQGVYNMAKQKQITAWADLGNKAAHGDWSEYSDKDIVDMINGIERFIGDYL